MEDKGETKELDEVLDLFISSKDRKEQVPWAEKRPGASNQAQEKKPVPLVVTTSIRKEIACPPGQGAQDRIRGLLFEYLQDDYEITKIELRKVTQRKDVDKDLHQEEEICILVKDQ